MTTVVPIAWGVTYSGTIHSTILAEDRKFSIFIPKSFDTNRRKYPVVYLTDGEYYFERGVVAMRELASVGHAPECIVVGIETPQRTQDMTPPGMGKELAEGEERADKLLRFLAKELKPAISQKFRTTNPSVLIGHSHGGILAHYAAANWRREFPFIISLDGPMHLANGWLQKNLEKSFEQGGYVRLVSLEVRFGWTDKDWDHFKISAPKNWTLVRRKLVGEDHESMVFDGFFEGLKEVFADYSSAYRRDLSPETLFAHYDGLPAFYGAAVTPPRSVLERALDAFMVQGKADSARKVLNVLSEGYKDPDNRAQIEKDIDEAAKMMKGQETIEQILHSPRPSEEQMKPYLGDWTGTVTRGENVSPHTLTFEMKDGKVTGSLTTYTGEESLRMPLEFIRQSPTGLEFGFMNGMHPRGVISYSAKLERGKLVGSVAFKGIYFVWPKEFKYIKEEFSFQKVSK